MSKFLDIGIPVTGEEYENTLNELWEISEMHMQTPAGQYRVFRDPSGAEVWLSMSSTNEASVNCHFSGNTVWEVGIEHYNQNPESEMDGQLLCWVEGKWDREKGEWSGLFPLAVNLPDFQCNNRLLPAPTFAKLQLCAFASSIAILNSEDDFHAYAKSHVGELPLAVESFIPTGLWSEEYEEFPYALISGIIRECSQRVNAYSGLTFWTADVQTAGGILNVVCDPGEVSGTPSQGSIMISEVFMSGRIVNELAAD